MKNWIIRLQTLAILLVFFSPVFYLAYKHYSPQIELYKYDQARKETEVNYPKLTTLSTQGKDIVDSQGNKVVLKGVNIASTTWGAEYEAWNSKAVTQAIKSWRSNVIRARIYQYEYEDNPANFFLKLETQILEPARRSGAYIIIHPWFGENQSLPDSKGVAMWQAVARRYANDPHIIYDLFAEPRDISWTELRDSYTKIIPLIREVAPNSLIMVTGLDWGREINSWIGNPLPYPNIVYRTNPYNRSGEFESYFGRIATELPVFIGEFGTEPKLSMQESDVTSLLAYADKLGIGWTAWHFSDSGCPCLLTDNDSFTPSSYGQIVAGTLLGQPLPDYSLPIFDTDSNKYYLYSDFLENGYSDYSWLSKTTLQSPATSHVGKYSLQAVMSNAGGVYLHSSQLTNPQSYSTFNFAVRGDNWPNLILRFRASDDSLSNPIMIKDFVVADGEWQKVSIPVSLINISNVIGASWESSEPISGTTTIYLDQIYFSK